MGRTPYVGFPRSMVFGRANRLGSISIFWSYGSLLRLAEIPEYCCVASMSLFRWTTRLLYYLNKGGGTRSRRLNQLARDLTLWCMARWFSLVAVQLAGVDIVQADRLSHHRVENPRRID